MCFSRGALRAPQGFMLLLVARAAHHGIGSAVVRSFVYNLYKGSGIHVLRSRSPASHFPSRQGGDEGTIGRVSNFPRSYNPWQGNKPCFETMRNFSGGRGSVRKRICQGWNVAVSPVSCDPVILEHVKYSQMHRPRYMARFLASGITRFSENYIPARAASFAYANWQCRRAESQLQSGHRGAGCYTTTRWGGSIPSQLIPTLGQKV